MNRKTVSDRLFDFFNVTLFILVLLLIMYPMYFILIASVSDPVAINAGKVWLWPVDFNWKGYETIFMERSIWMGYKNSLVYAILGAAFSTALTISGGYALSRKDLVGRTPIMLFILFTMFFQGGLIPSYILIKNLGMLDTIWAMVIPGAVSAFLLIITRTFFQQSIPDELLEASMMDGCNNTRFFFRIVLPLSLPIIAVIALFNAVGQWNSYFKALIYITNEDLQPLQIILRRILVKNQASELLRNVTSAQDMVQYAELIKYGLIIVASLPMLVLYPFLQKYFVKGMMIGSVKG
ncbi:carbohydrate ABC transporter permease [Paenibacillus eucommiae]|uniref:Aldouronate transport system permease protein n=1 Tax=Paenibacillus eucommiae TaxID=1355755 RepID=A0ABS4J9S3_9BACL|nr:carbohydrate ABC transporter permease [Paenibacillus eucommiae]MBP1996609.1 putative aldouronate transport system permease protein [Paenibacillus eucommiae]